ncbi:hypothetical protein ACQ4PT_035169 [Festuca glaucescens]
MVCTTMLLQDTLKAASPSEAKVMKKATAVSVAATTVIYLLCGCVGYAAFGDGVKDNLLTGFGFYEPFWLLDVANACVAVHLVGTYQVITQPIFAYVELRAAAAWPDSAFVATKEVTLWPTRLRVAVCPLRLTWLTAYVCVTTAVSMSMPFFGSVVGLIGAISFWPLTVYFPVEMYMAQHRLPRGSTKWLFLQALSAVCLIVCFVISMFYIVFGDFLNNPLSSGFNYVWQKTPFVSIFDFSGAT